LGVIAIGQNVVSVCCITTTTSRDFRAGQATFGQQAGFGKEEPDAG
jgi:hypothetical protein